MKEIDQVIYALAAYIIISLLLSLVTSAFESHPSDKNLKPFVSSNSAVSPNKRRKEKLIKPGYNAFCNVCERYLESDTYLKNHLEGQKHKKKASNFQGEIYKIVEISKKK